MTQCLMFWAIVFRLLLLISYQNLSLLILHILCGTIHVASIWVVCCKCTSTLFIIFFHLSFRFMKICSTHIRIKFWINFNYLYNLLNPLDNLWMICNSTVALDVCNLISVHKVKIYLLYVFFQLLLVEIISNRACFLTIWICNPKIHILCQQYLVVKLSEITLNNNNFLPQLHVQELECGIHQLFRYHEEQHEVFENLVLKSWT